MPAPDTLRRLDVEAGRLVHTNHFLDPAALGVQEPALERLPHSVNRLHRFCALLDDDAPTSRQALETHLRDHEDHPYSICRHIDAEAPAEEHYITVASIIMDLTEGIFLVADGPPCGATYDVVRLASRA